MKIISFSFYLIMVCASSYAQTIVLRPLYGTKYTRTKPQNVIDNFDPSFTGNNYSKHYDKGINLEWMKPKFSIEVGYGDREHSFRFDTRAPEGGFRIIKGSTTTTSELHLMYNKFLPKLFSRWDQKVSLVPILSLGGNIGFNNSQKRYTADSSFDIDRVIYQQNPERYIDYEMRDSVANKVVYSIQFKIGLNARYQGVERLRLQFYYTYGLNNIASRTYRYYHTDKFYSGKIFTKGNEYGIVASIPLYIKRKR